MRLSTRGRYAVRSLIDLALNMDDGYVSLQSISQRQEISLHYLEQIFNKLKKSNIVESKKGLGGGYLLARPATEITIGDIIRSVEGPIAPVHCVNPGSEKDKCDKADNCIAHMLWTQLEKKMENFLDDVNLEQIKNDANNIICN